MAFPRVNLCRRACASCSSCRGEELVLVCVCVQPGMGWGTGTIKHDVMCSKWVKIILPRIGVVSRLFLRMMADAKINGLGSCERCCSWRCCSCCHVAGARQWNQVSLVGALSAQLVIFNQIYSIIDNLISVSSSGN